MTAPAAGSSSPVLVTGWIEWVPEHREQVLEHAAAVAAASRAEKDCLGYAFTLDPEHAGRVQVFEHFTSEAALREHLALPHVAAFRAAIADLTQTGRELSLHTVTDTRPMTT